MKIATHNSGTGETCKWWRRFIIPFAKCQTKTLKEQYRAGCRYFDLRVRYKHNIHDWVFAHGFWESEETALELIQDLYFEANEPLYFMLTYEGHYTEEKEKMIMEFAKWVGLYGTITTINIKKPDWITLEVRNNIKHKQCFEALNRFNPRMWIPIPWLWRKKDVEFNDDYYSMVDFL